MAAARKNYTLWNLIYLISICGTANSLFNQPKAVIDPPDSFVIIGETVRVTCSSSELFKGDVSQVQFKITTNNNAWFLPTENQTDLGNSVVQTYVHVTEQFSSITSLSCFHREKQVRSTKIYTEKPLMRINITKIFFEDRGSYVHFTWLSNTKYYIDPDKIQTKALYSFGGQPENWTTDGTACGEIPDFVCDANQAIGYNIYIRFYVSYSTLRKRPGLDYLQPLFDTQVSSDYNFTFEDIRKTTPVTDVQLKDVGKVCTNVTWTLPYYIAEICYKCPQLLYMIELIEGGNEKLLFEGTQRPPASGQSVQVCGLTPFTQYTLTVRVKVQEVNPWSDPSIPIQLTTAEDRPLAGPLLMDTGYHTERSCNNGKRQMLIYWKPQPKSIIRGELIGYTIQVLEDSTKVRSSSNFFRTYLPCSTQSEVKISALNKAGPSLEPSTLHVPAENGEQDLVQTSDILLVVKEVPNEKRDKKQLAVSWKSQDFKKNGPQVSLTFYFCEEAGPSSCFNDYETVQVEAGKGEILLENISQSQNLFGYSLNNSIGQKTGIIWTECVYQGGLIPPKPTDLQAVSGAESGSVNVMWADMRCNRQNKVLVTNYNVSICPKNLHIVEDQRQSHRSCKSVKILSQEGNTHVFRNLDVGRPYIIHVQAESDGGASQFTTTEFTPSDKGNSVSNIGLIMGILSLIILLAMIFLCFAWRYCRTRCKKANEMVKQNMQSMGQSEKMSIGHSESDSGVYSTTDKQKLVSLPPSGPQQEEAKVNAAPHKQSQPNARLSKLTSPHTDNQKNQQSEEAISSYSKQAPQDNHAKNEQTKNALIDKTNSSHMRFRNVTKQLACIEEDKGIGSTKDHRAHSPLDLWQRKDMCGPPKVNVCVAVEAPSSHARSSMAPGIASMKSMPSENEYSQQGIHKGGNRPLVDLVQSSNKLSDGYSEDPLSLDRDDVSCDGSEDSGDRDGYGDQSDCDDGYKEDAERMASDSLHLKNDGYAEDRVAADPAYDGYKYNESGSKTGQFWEESSLCSESEREDVACSSVEREPTSSGYQCHSFLQASSMPAHRV